MAYLKPLLIDLLTRKFADNSTWKFRALFNQGTDRSTGESKNGDGPDDPLIQPLYWIGSMNIVQLHPAIMTSHLHLLLIHVRPFFGENVSGILFLHVVLPSFPPWHPILQVVIEGFP